MDEVTLYLNKTNKSQFCNWLSVYCKKKQVESKQYAYIDGQVYNFYYPFSISPDFQSELKISANFTKIVDANEIEEKYTMDWWDIENALRVSWLEIGERMKVTMTHSLGKWTIPPFFDLLAEIGKDWIETRHEIWNYIERQAENYHVELVERPFPLDLNEIKPTNLGKKRRETIIKWPFASTKDKIENYLVQRSLEMKISFKSFEIDLPQGRGYGIIHSDYGELGQLSIHPREDEIRLRFTKPNIPSQGEAIESYIKAGYNVPKFGFEAVDWLFQRRENANEEFWNDLLRYLRSSEMEITDPRELYGISFHSMHNIELLEKTLAGLPMKALSEIDFCTFEKLPDQPYGHVRYNVHDSVDTYLGCITMETRGNEATTIGLQYQMKFDVTFKKIKAIWDRHIAYDLELSTIGKEKQRSNSETVNVISQRTAALNRLAVLWVTYNEMERISKNDDMQWFIDENAKAVGLNYLTVNEFKKHLPKAYRAGIIDKDPRSRRYIPKLGT